MDKIIFLDNNYNIRIMDKDIWIESNINKIYISLEQYLRDREVDEEIILQILDRYNQ